MAKKQFVTFAVTFPLPEGATVIEARQYVEAAVCTWKGSLPPFGVDPEDPDYGDPMFYLDNSKVRVTHRRQGD